MASDDPDWAGRVPGRLARRGTRRAELDAEMAQELRLFELERALATAEAERDALRIRVTRLEASSGQDAGTAEALSAVHDALAHQLTLVRGAVALVRDQLAGAVATERAAREEAEALVARLESDLAGRVARLAETAAQLGGGLAETDRLRTEIAAMQSRLGDVQEGLRAELERERAARWVAERELDAERAAHALTRKALEALRDGERRGPDPTALADLRATLEGLRVPPTATVPALSLDLAAAAERLRAAAQAAGDPTAHEAPPVEGSPAVAQPGAGERPASVAATEPAASPDASAEPVGAAAATEPPASPDVNAEPAAEGAEPARAASPDASPAADRERARSLAEPEPLPARKAPAGAPTWLRDALVAYAAEDPDAAERLLVQLVAAQAGLTRKPVAYDLVVTGGGAHRVALDRDRAEVAPRPAGALPADARVAGPLAALLPLVAGGARRRLPDLEVEGRRRLRKLVKARKRPMTLAGLAELELAAPDPRLLLALLAHGVDPAWTTGRPLVVDVEETGSMPARVTVPDGGRPEVTEPGEAAATATLRVPEGGLLPVLAGVAPAGTGTVTGDPGAVGHLLDLLDRARREA